MEDTGKNLELIDKFIANERKSKIWAIVSVSLFLVMAALVLVFSKELSETKSKLTVSEDSLRYVNARLTILNDSIQKAKDSVDLINIGLELSMDKNAYEIDSLADVNDTLTVLLNKTQQEFIQHNSPESATQKINDLFDKAFPGPNRDPSNEITEAIIKTNRIIQRIEPISISILYMHQYTVLGTKINKLLGSKKFEVERMEPVSGTSFNPAVKYFRPEDKAMADQISRMLNDSYASELNLRFISQLVRLRSPAHHLEVWIGKYEKPRYLKQPDTIPAALEIIKY